MAAVHWLPLGSASEGSLASPFGTLNWRSAGSLAAAAAAGPFTVLPSVHSMFDWPEASHTSPT